MMGKKVYIGGGVTENVDDFNQVLQYDLSTDEWSRLPPHLIVAFAMAQFMEHLITVGGRIRNGRFTGKVYCFKEKPNKWVEFLTPMPTARYHLSVTTTQFAIVASGGSTGFKDGKAVPCDIVEVYSSETSQWHTTDSLPVPHGGMISVTIADTWYQLGGGNCHVCSSYCPHSESHLTCSPVSQPHYCPHSESHPTCSPVSQPHVSLEDPP